LKCPLLEKANEYVSYLPFSGSWLENSNLRCNLAAGESPLGANPETPIGALIIRGNFTTIKQDNKTSRLMIDLGRWASDVQAHVLISLISGTGSLLLSEAKSCSEPRYRSVV
jgi:hypothetical protein